MRVGDQLIELIDPGPAHTHSDLVVYLPEHNIVATGDLMWQTFYPYVDPSRSGSSLSGWIDGLRTLAGRYPDAVFVPGHGPLATARDLTRFADYLEHLRDAVSRALEDGLSEDEAVRSIDLSRWRLRPIPSLLKGRLSWATAELNVRTVYRMSKEER